MCVCVCVSVGVGGGYKNKNGGKCCNLQLTCVVAAPTDHYRACALLCRGLHNLKSAAGMCHCSKSLIGIKANHRLLLLLLLLLLQPSVAPRTCLML